MGHYTIGDDKLIDGADFQAHLSLADRVKRGILFAGD
jgi:hypothetical protein